MKEFLKQLFVWAVLAFVATYALLLVWVFLRMLGGCDVTC
jgi:hypothetical protein